jgi:uncharacterized membrane protein
MTPPRLVLKSISYRIVSYLLTACTILYLTGSLKAALSLGAVDGVTKFCLYLAHEGVWEKLRR